MTGSARPATVRFYLDADVLGLAKLLVTIRSDVTYPGDPGGVVHRRQRPACPIIAVAGVDAGGTWEQLETFMNQWRAIEKKLDEPGPFIYTATRTTLRPVDLTMGR